MSGWSYVWTDRARGKFRPSDRPCKHTYLPVACVSTADNCTNLVAGRALVVGHRRHFITFGALADDFGVFNFAFGHATNGVVLFAVGGDRLPGVFFRRIDFRTVRGRARRTAMAPHIFAVLGRSPPGMCCPGAPCLLLSFAAIARDRRRRVGDKKQHK